GDGHGPPTGHDQRQEGEQPQGVDEGGALANLADGGRHGGQEGGQYGIGEADREEQGHGWLLSRALALVPPGHPPATASSPSSVARPVESHHSREPFSEEIVASRLRRIV